MNEVYSIYERIENSKVENTIKSNSLKEGLSREEVDRLSTEEINSMLNNPLLQICATDITLEFWVNRIQKWYKNIKVIHIDPLFNLKEQISLDKMLEILEDRENLEKLGQFDVQPVSAEKCILFRKYGNYKEELIVEAEFDKSRLRKKV